jgi:DNA-binding NtrC family response regulator
LQITLMSILKLLQITENSIIGRPDWDFIKTEFNLIQATNLSEAVGAIQSEKPDITLVTGDISECDRLDVLEVLQSVEPLLPVCFFSATMSAAEAVRLVRSGAYNCFCPKDSVETLRQCLKHAAAVRRQKEKRTLANSAQPRWLMGESRAIQDSLSLLRLIGPRRCTVLITGETGTGKELAARELHAASPRAHLPMVSVNCSALPEHLLEAELFGHVKGAFTGAVSHRTGRFEQANKSTLFLDEVVEMPIELQAKLLRALLEREIQRLGSSETIKVDVRVVAATNCDVLEKVRQGKFREDLYYRLNVVPLRLPSLQERTSDIPILADHFVAKICRSEGIAVKHIPEEVKDRLSRMTWPGNVRQLENAVEMAVAISGDREVLGPADFALTSKRPNMTVMEPPDWPLDFSKSIPFDQVVNEFQLSLLQKALSKTHGNKTAAADLLGMKRTTLIMKMRGLESAGNTLAAVV